jgi:Rieske Fe-S protein
MCGGALLPACGAGASGEIDAGNVADIAEGEIKKGPDGSTFLLARDAGGIYAMTSICTHFGCDLNDEGGVIGDDGEIDCGSPCGHGSKFGPNGEVVAGPAGEALKHWKVTIDEAGAILVDVGNEVPAEERAAVA